MTSIPDALGRLWSADDLAPMIQCDGAWVSWGTVRSLTERVDEALTAEGCGPGHRVGVVLANRMESVAAVLAILRGRRTLVTLSPLQPPERLSADLVACRAPFVLAPETVWSAKVFTDAMAEVGAAGWSVDADAVTPRAHAARPPVPGDSAVAVEMLTSGTTGAPKRVPLTHAQFDASLSSALRHNERPEVRDKPPLSGAVGMVTLPIVHIGGLFALLQSLMAARPIVMLDRFTLSGWHAAVREHKPVIAGLPPAAIRSVLDSDIPREDLASLRVVTSGTSPVDPHLVDTFYERYGVPILITYGATEFSGAVAGWAAADFKARWHEKKGSVGRAFPGVRLQVVDEGGAVVAPGRSGRLRIASPQAGDGWVTTSDLAHLDDDGYLYIDGRADDVIMRGGFKVAPETVQKALRTHPAVADAAIAGLPDPRLGHIPFAAVELRPGARATPDELRAHCRSQLTPYEVPAQIFVVDALPRGAALKVDRRQLVGMLEDLRVKSDARRTVGQLVKEES